MARWGRIVAGAAAVFGVGALALAWRAPAVSVETAAVRAGSISVEIVEDGRTRVIDRYVVSSPVAGALQRITLRPGERVEAGQTVAQLMPAPAAMLDPRTRAEAEARRAGALDAARRADVAITAAALAADLAARDADRVRALGDHATRQQLEQAVALASLRAQELASAQFARRVAGHEVESAEALLGRRAGSAEGLDLASPVSGVVLAVLQPSAGVVGPGTPLLEIGDPAGLEVVVDVLTTDAVRIAPDAPVVLERWGGEPLAGHVRSVEPQAFTRMSALGVEEQRVNVLVTIDAARSQWMALGDGFRVEARVGIARADGVLLAPETSVIRVNGQPSAFRVAGGAAELVPIEIGLRNGVDAEVRSGLSEGDLLVIHPSEAVADGVRVRQ